MKANIFVSIVLLTATQTSCVHSFSSLFGSFDQKPFVIKTLNLHNQRVNSQDALAPPWQSDWIIRRERLKILDIDLQGSKPDVVVFQELMVKDENFSESDVNILSAGALDAYQWDLQKVGQYNDSNEGEYLAVSFAPQFYDENILKNQKISQKYWQIDQGIQIAVHLGFHEGEAFMVWNVNSSLTTEFSESVLAFLQERMDEMQSNTGICKRRMIVAGFFPVSTLQQSFLQFKENNRFRDTSEGNCGLEKQCQTWNDDDPFITDSRSHSAIPIKQVDRILVHEDTMVYSSKVEFKNFEDSDAYAKGLGLKKLFPGRRFGWGANIRLPRCGNVYKK